MLSSVLNKYWLYLLSFLFIILNSIFIALEQYWFALIPFALGLLYLTFFSLDKLMFFIVFFTPLSINIENFDLGGIGMYLPTEPLMFGVMVLFFLKVIYDKRFDNRIIFHPISLAIIFNLVWMFITSLTSELPVVSFKYLLARLWFVVCFYFLATQLFQNLRRIKIFMWSYLLPMTLVIGYALYNLSGQLLDQNAAHFVMQPFFKDHTSYGAILALLFPTLFFLLNVKEYKLGVKTLIVCLIIFYTLGIIFSYTRAAWVSLAGAFVLFLIYRFKISFRFLAFLGIIGGLIFYLSWPSLMMKIEKNRQDSSGDLAEHVQSISNISSDASNLERINRWESAQKMFNERPVFGWGPGTYAFLYAPFQLSKNKTIISTNAGDLGNAHSEYIGPLAESGVLGMLSMLAIVIAIFYKGSMLYHQLPNGETKKLVLVMLLCLFTYFTHGMLNNYLDTDKASVLVWGFAAIIVAVDVYMKDDLLKADSH